MYEMDIMHDDNLRSLNISERNDMITKSFKSKKALLFLDDYKKPETIFSLKLPTISLIEWKLSNNTESRLIRNLNNSYNNNRSNKNYTLRYLVF